jgi:hypothetical protein
MLACPTVLRGHVLALLAPGSLLLIPLSIVN